MTYPLAAGSSPRIVDDDERDRPDGDRITPKRDLRDWPDVSTATTGSWAFTRGARMLCGLRIDR